MSSPHHAAKRTSSKAVPPKSPESKKRGGLAKLAMPPRTSSTRIPTISEPEELIAEVRSALLAADFRRANDLIVHADREALIGACDDSIPEITVGQPFRALLDRYSGHLTSAFRRIDALSDD